jgi:nitroreductase
MDLDEVIRKRRTIRRFSSKVVEKEIIIKIIDNARWAPSACNEQLWHFIIVKVLLSLHVIII